MIKRNIPVVFATLALTALSASLFGQSTSSALSQRPTFIRRYQARVSATQAEQPRWATPVATPTPRLTQGMRTDFVHSYNSSGYATWNYGNSKGIKFIPEQHTEIIVNVPPFYARSNGASDGFGDISLEAKYRIFTRTEEHGDAVITAILGASIPTGKNGNGSCCAKVTPTLAVGKGFKQIVLTTTLGGSLPISNASASGHTITWNNVVQYRLARRGLGRLFWPEVELNSHFYKGGPHDGQVTTFGTPGLVVGRIPLSHTAEGAPGRLGLVLGIGEQIALTQFHTCNHATIISVRMPF